MTELLEKAITEARKLSPNEQDALAALILEELADEARWAKSFGASQSLLETLADEALKELAEGKASPLEFPPKR
jgi:hypothetical protein